MKEKIKELRVKIDGLSQLVKELKPCNEKSMTVDFGNQRITFIHNKIIHGEPFNFNSLQIEKAYDSLILAKAWLGKVLGELGENTPYTNDGKRKTVGDIEPTADTAIGSNQEAPLELGQWGKMNHIEKVDWLRQEIQHIIHLVEQTIFTSNQSRELAIARTNSYNHLCEARFWLGFELQRIKENK